MDFIARFELVVSKMFNVGFGLQLVWKMFIQVLTLNWSEFSELFQNLCREVERFDMDYLSFDTLFFSALM